MDVNGVPLLVRSICTVAEARKTDPTGEGPGKMAVDFFPLLFPLL